MTIFVVSPEWDYEGLGEPVAAFTTEEAAKAWVERQAEVDRAHRAWQREEPRTYATGRDSNPLFYQMAEANHDAWAAREPERPIHTDDWNVSSVEIAQEVR